MNVLLRGLIALWFVLMIGTACGGVESTDEGGIDQKTIEDVISGRGVYHTMIEEGPYDWSGMDQIETGVSKNGLVPEATCPVLPPPTIGAPPPRRRALSAGWWRATSYQIIQMNPSLGCYGCNQPGASDSNNPTTDYLVVNDVPRDDVVEYHVPGTANTYVVPTYFGYTYPDNKGVSYYTSVQEGPRHITSTDRTIRLTRPFNLAQHWTFQLQLRRRVYDGQTQSIPLMTQCLSAIRP